MMNPENLDICPTLNKTRRRCPDIFNKDSSIFFASLLCLINLDDEGKNKNTGVDKASVKHRIYIKLQQNPIQRTKRVV
jgi:hypothetical protein